MKWTKSLLIFSLIFSSTLGAQTNIESFVCPDTNNSFRAIAALSPESVWLASDNAQVWFFDRRTGWRDCSPQSFPEIMWRDIHAYSDSIALILSAGSPGIILRTVDAGRSWQEVYRDDDPAIFFDAFDFYGSRGLAFSDAQGDYLGLIESLDSGKTWQAWPRESPDLKVLPNQGGFAASGSCLRMLNAQEAMIVLGGPQAVFKRIGPEPSINKNLPLDDGEPSKGAFSVDAKNNDTLIAVGGDYRADSLSSRSVALSFDAGNTWHLASDWPLVQNSYWSTVSWDHRQIVLCSRFKTAISNDNGATWQFYEQGFYAFHRNWFSGAKGRIGRIKTF